MARSAAEQYLLELINRARLDPAAEAARQRVPLTAGGVDIDSTAKQVLAPNDALQTAAETHVAWMFRADVFAHEGATGDRAVDRAAALGYIGRVGENLAWLGQTGSTEAWVNLHFANLWASPDHRPNTMRPEYREIGVVVQNGIGGIQTAPNTPASLLAEVFGARSQVFVTGVVYDDRNGNGLYNMGEGQTGTRFAADRTVDTSEAAGGWAVGVASGAAVPLTVTAGGVAVDLTVDTRAGNVKIDVVGGDRLDVSGSFDLIDGGFDVRMLGVGRIDGSGSDAGESIAGNKGNNRIAGEGGADSLAGGDGQDTLAGGEGRDQLSGNSGNDRVQGDAGNDQIFGQDGNDTLTGGFGNDRLTGGAGADRFVFGRGGGRDIVTDVEARQGDRIVLDDAMWAGAKSAEQIVADYARVGPAGHVILDFGNAGIVELRGVGSTIGLAALIDII